jgi:hypothetical protein
MRRFKNMRILMLNTACELSLGFVTNESACELSLGCDINERGL